MAFRRQRRHGTDSHVGSHHAEGSTIEPNFRDTKDLLFGISEPTRRDRLLLVGAFAMALLTMLDAAGEGLGAD